MTNTIPVIQGESFWRRVEIRGEHDCWPWLGGRGSTGKGYGRVCIARKSRPATQVAWELANEKPFPAGLVACHACDNSICVNPAHIWPGTQSDNIRDCVAKGRHASRPQPFCQRGHAMEGDNLEPTKNGFRCRTCSRVKNLRNVRLFRARKKANG